MQEKVLLFPAVKAMIIVYFDIRVKRSNVRMIIRTVDNRSG